VTAVPGGSGAVREVCEMLLALSGKWRRFSANTRSNKLAFKFGLEVVAGSGPGILHQITGVIAERGGDILNVGIIEDQPPETRIYFELEVPEDPASLVEDLEASPVVRRVIVLDTMEKIFGKRIHHRGRRRAGGQVALGAIAEADRHNIRGEHISVDTIPLVASCRWPPRYAPPRACLG
jgi:energy-converting hydrogenase B subunit Q